MKTSRKELMDEFAAKHSEDLSPGWLDSLSTPETEEQLRKRRTERWKMDSGAYRPGKMHRSG